MTAVKPKGWGVTAAPSNSTDRRVVRHPDCHVAFTLVQPGPYPTEAAAKAAAAGKLAAIVDQRFKVLARRLAPAIPDDPSQYRRLRRYLETFKAVGLIKSAVGAKTWPKLHRLAKSR